MYLYVFQLIADQEQRDNFLQFMAMNSSKQKEEETIFEVGSYDE